MNYLKRMEIWGNTHHPKWLDYVRIILGILLCYKAIAFLINMSYLVSIMKSAIDQDMSAFMVVFFGQFIVIVTLISGIFLIFGIHTRLVCAIQIPILIGAIILLNRSGATSTFELLFTLITLVLLVTFLVLGNGPLSYSRMFREEDKAYRDAQSI